MKTPLALDGNLHITAPWGVRLTACAHGAGVDVCFERRRDLIHCLRPALEMRHSTRMGFIVRSLDSAGLSLSVALRGHRVAHRPVGSPRWQPRWRGLGAALAGRRALVL